MPSDTAPRSRGIEFGGGVLPPVVFLALSSLVPVVIPVVVYPHVHDLLTFLVVMSASFGLIGIVAWGVLRWEGLSLADVGFSRENVVPGVVLVLGIYVLLNLLGAGYLFLSGESVSFALPEQYATPVLFVAASIAYFGFNGIAEELAFRAYFQNKLIALLDGGTDRTRKPAAILLGVALFSLWHLPQRILIAELTTPGAIAQSLVSVVILGTVLGLLYEYTRNAVLVGVLHGTFNLQPFLVEGMPANDLVLFVGLPLLLIAVWRYRRWARRRHPLDFAPQRQVAQADSTGSPSD